MSLMIFLQQQEPTTFSISPPGTGQEVLCLPATYLVKMSMWTRSDYVTKACLAYDSGLEHNISFNASEGKKTSILNNKVPVTSVFQVIFPSLPH